MGFFDFLGKIGDLFGEIASLLSQLFAILWNAMLAALTFIWNTLVAVFNFTLGVFQKVGAFFARAWSDYIKPAIQWVFQEIGKIYAKVRSVLDPAIKWIQKIRKWYDTHILPILIRQIQMIQRIRQFLRILRILHVKWATKLDNYLADLQSKIEMSIELVRGYLNQIINWISLITDPSMIIRRNTLGAWLLANLGIIKRAFDYGGNRNLTADEQNTATKNRSMFYPANIQAHAQALLTGGLTPDDRARRDAVRAAMAQATGQPLAF